MQFVSVLQGECRVSGSKDVVFTTVLGSCIAVCLHDPIRSIGGMNHFLLPGDGNSTSKDKRFGFYSMELLINELLKIGARKKDLTARLYGGASVIENNSNIGISNYEFAKSFLSREGIRCIDKDVGGKRARRLKFTPTTGLTQNTVVPGAADQIAPAKPSRLNSRPDVTLF